MPYSVHYRGAADVHEVLLQSAVIAAFRSWGEVPTSSLQFQRFDLYTVAEGFHNGSSFTAEP